MSLRSLRITLVLILVSTLFVISFHQPAILFRQMSTDSTPHILHPAGLEVKTGIQMALGGLFGPLFGNFAILANPLLLAGCVLILGGKNRLAVRCLALAVLLALQTFQLMLLPYHEDEGGVMVSFMVHPLLGWYCWFGAILLAFLLAVERQRSGLRENPPLAATPSSSVPPPPRSST